MWKLPLILIVSVALDFSSYAQANKIADSVALKELQDEKSEIKERLIGSWILEKNPLEKIAFTRDNKLKRYFNDELRSVEIFSIDTKCGDEILSKGYFLVTTSNNENTSCAYLDNVNDYGSGFLTLVTEFQGKIIIYRRI